MAEDFGGAMFRDAPVACALYRICPEQPDPWEGEVSDVNPAFEAFFGRTAEQVVGRRLSSLAAEMPLLPPDWGRIGAAALERPVDARWEAGGRMLSLRAFSPRPGELAVFYTRPAAAGDDRGAQMAGAVEALLRATGDRIDYFQIAERLRVLSGARFVLMNLCTREGGSSTIRCIAGAPDQVEWAQQQLGLRLVGRVWPDGPLAQQCTGDQAFLHFTSLTEMVADYVPRLALQAIDTALELGPAVVAPLACDGRLLGEFILLMPRGQALSASDDVQTFCRYVALALERIHGEGTLWDSDALPAQNRVIATLGRWEWDRATDTLLFSREVCAILGVDPFRPRLSCEDFLARVAPEDVEDVRRTMAECRSGGHAYELTYRVRDGQGQYKWIHEVGRTLADGQGRPLRTVGTMQDITRLRQAEERIGQLQDEYETLFNGTQEALFLIEVSGPGQYRYLRSNLAHAQKTGIAREDFAGKTPQELFGKEMGDKLCAEYAQCLEVGRPVTFEEALPVGDGRRIWSTTLTPVFRSGRNTCIVGLMEDITAQKEYEQSVRSSLALSQVLVSVLQHPVHTVEEYLDFVLEQAIRLTGSRCGHILTYDEPSRQMQVVSWSRDALDFGGAELSPVFDPQGSDVWSRVIKERRALILNDFPADSPPPGCEQVRHYLVVPVFDAGRIVALIGVADKALPYTDTDVMQLTILMSNVWVVVQSKRSEELLNREKELFRTTLLSIGDGIIAVDNEGRVRLMNHVAQHMTGWTQQEAVGLPFDQVCHIYDETTRLRRESSIRKVLETGRSIGHGNHALMVSRNGEEHIVAESAAPITGADGGISGVVLVYRDISMERQKMEAIEYLSYHDPLTGLYNRAFYNEELRRLDTARNLPIAIVMADVNGLKLTNDAFGHAMGDKLLQKSAEVIRSCCREDDIIARIGGDEFVLLLPRTSNEDAEKIVERIRGLCASTRIGSVVLSISFGWETKTTTQEDIRQVQKNAEDRMYRRKLFDSPSMRGNTIQAIIQALYEAQPREERHSRQVSQLCEMVSKALNLSEREVKEITTAGLLHDIGKIGIDSRVLNKGGRLSPEEWREIKRHPEIGYRILSSVNDLSDTADCILAHHERWDGTGYPSLLRGTQIPLQARIIALADAFDAMTNERDYGARLTEDEALEQLRRNAGTQFDPDLVEVFITAYEKGTYEKGRAGKEPGPGSGEVSSPQ